MGDLWNQSVDGKGVVLNAGPGGARQRLADALMQLGGATVVVKDRGRLFLRNIAMVFDKYLREPATDDKPRYSRTA